MATTAKKKTTQKKSTTKKHKPAKKADTVKVKKVGAGEFRSAISLIRDGVRNGEDVQTIEQRVAKAFPKYLQRRVKIDYNWHIKHPEFLDVGQKKRKTA